VPYLQIFSPTNRTLVMLPNEAVTIGRSSSSGVQISEHRASRAHCVIEPTMDGFQLRDLGSRNGTQVDGEPIDVAPLSDGGEFQIGKTYFKFSIEDPRETRVELPDDDESEAEEKQPRRSFLPNFGRKKKNAEPEQAAVDLIPPIEPVADEEYEEGEQPANEDSKGYFSPAVDHDVSDPIAVLRRFMAPHAAPAFDENRISMINARGVTLHEADLSGEEDDHEVIGQVIRIMRLLLMAAFATRASDIHFEPRADECSIRMRVDGTMVDAVRVAGDLGRRLFGSVKVLADIDIAQRGVVQEGHFSALLGQRHVDYRVSFTPAMYGQKLVLRVLDPGSAPQHMTDLQLPDWMHARIQQTSLQSSGMVLVCGPTGSGKTTTLYAVLRDVDRRARNVVTIEDPVEYQLDGVTQIPINEQKGNTFHNLLRSVLRQDPDVILLGEIRDRETAETAMQASMTGHLVLSTVHAKDTIGTLFRLLDLGAEPYLVASSLNLILAQRLVRVLCSHCKSSRKPTPKQIHQMGAYGRKTREIFYPVGCEKCFDVGYHGRLGLYELLEMTNDIRDAILKDATMSAIREALGRTEFASLTQMGYRAVAKGITCVDEVDRVVGGL